MFPNYRVHLSPPLRPIKGHGGTTSPIQGTLEVPRPMSKKCFRVLLFTQKGILFLAVTSSVLLEQHNSITHRGWPTLVFDVFMFTATM